MSEWASATLGEVADRVSVKNVNEAVKRVMTVSAAHGLIDQERFFTKSVASLNLSTYCVLQPGDFVYNKSTSKEAEFGVVARLDGDAPAVVTPLYIPFRAKPGLVHPDFLLMAANGSAFFGSLAGTLREGARSHGLLNVRLNEFFAAKVVLPPLDEQRRIVAAMSAVDSQIEAMLCERERIEGLYRASLSSLSERYACRPVSAVVSRASAGGTPSREHPEYFGGIIPWIKSGEVESDSIFSSSERITEAGLANSSARWVESGSTLVAMYGQGETKGRAGFVVSPVTTNQAVLALTPDPSVVHDRYLMHAVRSRTESLRRRAVGAAQPNLSKALVVTEEIPVPDSLGVQRREANCLDAMLTTATTLRDELAVFRVVRADLLSAILSQEVTVDAAVDRFVKAA